MNYSNKRIVKKYNPEISYKTKYFDIRILYVIFVNKKIR